MKDINFLNVKISPYFLFKTLAIIKNAIEKKLIITQTSINVAKVVSAQKDLQLRNSINQSDIVNIDGYGVYFVLRLIGYKKIERIAGIDLFEKLLEISNDNRYSIYFLGGTDEIINNTVMKVKKNYPNIKISGHHHGYIWQNEREIVDTIKICKPNILFIGISSPLKENFINQWKDYIGANLYMGVGGSFEVFVGKIERAPLFIQKIGFEWLYRVVQEPRRLSKRYFITNTLYVFYLIKYFIKSKFKF